MIDTAACVRARARRPPVWGQGRRRHRPRRRVLACGIDAWRALSIGQNLVKCPEFVVCLFAYFVTCRGGGVQIPPFCLFGEPTGNVWMFIEPSWKSTPGITQKRAVCHAWAWAGGSGTGAAEHVFGEAAVQICWWHCFQRIMGQIAINMLSIWWIKHTTLSYRTMFSTRIIKALKNKFLSNLHPPKARQFFFFQAANNCLACWLSVHLLSLALFLLFQLHPWFSPFFFSALCSVSPPLLWIEPSSQPATVRGRYLVTTEKSIISTKQRGKEAIMKECSSFADDSRGH